MPGTDKEIPRNVRPFEEKENFLINSSIKRDCRRGCNLNFLLPVPRLLCCASIVTCAYDESLLPGLDIKKKTATL